VQLKSLGLERPKDSLVRAVADHLTLGLFEGGAEIKERQQTAAAIGALHEMYPGESEPRIKRALNSACRRAPDKDVAIVIGFQVFLSQVWDWLDEDNRLRVKEFVRQLSAARAPQILPYALRIGELADVCAERIGTLDAQVLGEVLQKNSHPIAIAKAVDLYCGSRNWSEGNAAYDKAIEPIIDKLDADQVRRILKAPGTGADLHSAHSFVAFARHVYEKEKLPQDEIIRILEEQGLTNVVRRLRPDPADTITF
jgi:hypothetical protein